MVVKYKTLELPSSWSDGVMSTDGSPFFATIEEARQAIPHDAIRLAFEPLYQSLELWETPEVGG